MKHELVRRSEHEGRTQIIEVVGWNKVIEFRLSMSGDGLIDMEDLARRYDCDEPFGCLYPEDAQALSQALTELLVGRRLLHRRWNREHARTHKLCEHPGRKNLTVLEAKKIMRTAQYREWTRTDRDSPYNGIEILHEGKWKNVGRTDDCDDVATGWCTTKSVEEWIKHYRKSIVHGARYDDALFSVVDAMTDG